MKKYFICPPQIDIKIDHAILEYFRISKIDILNYMISFSFYNNFEDDFFDYIESILSNTEWASHTFEEVDQEYNWISNIQELCGIFFKFIEDNAFFIETIRHGLKEYIVDDVFIDETKVGLVLELSISGMRDVDPRSGILIELYQELEHTSYQDSFFLNNPYQYSN